MPLAVHAMAADVEHCILAAQQAQQSADVPVSAPTHAHNPLRTPPAHTRPLPAETSSAAYTQTSSKRTKALMSSEARLVDMVLSHAKDLFTERGLEELGAQVGMCGWVQGVRGCG